MTEPVPAGYRPTENEPYMNPRQIAYFRQKLLDMRADLVREIERIDALVSDEGIREPDIGDQASAEFDRELNLLNRERTRQIVARVDRALNRIADDVYGYCEETGEPIGLKRLEAEPTAALSVEAQERQERARR
ncbi:TraR/DksA family transcriptional regulator [Limobrevibacterium gyesilva]|uniref:TraR/DksA family transcriptional regulator n=1 Tax=Limobrevibacterium gyesilva TaxID=2991712 RepID=A0AA41YIV4_9PROT|nr:TraR/DksA family transcriptional regulator [Limobrevibacterium gyesilva]MCW3473934.1 TraR/DksA family transcriptional regulator [Limobrevibacterium gyesilva]